MSQRLMTSVIHSVNMYKCMHMNIIWSLSIGCLSIWTFFILCDPLNYSFHFHSTSFSILDRAGNSSLKIWLAGLHISMPSRWTRWFPCNSATHYFYLKIYTNLAAFFQSHIILTSHLTVFQLIWVLYDRQRRVWTESSVRGKHKLKTYSWVDVVFNQTS